MSLTWGNFKTRTSCYTLGSCPLSVLSKHTKDTHTNMENCVSLNRSIYILKKKQNFMIQNMMININHALVLYLLKHVCIFFFDFKNSFFSFLPSRYSIFRSDLKEGWLWFAQNVIRTVFFFYFFKYELVNFKRQKFFV